MFPNFVSIGKNSKKNSQSIGVENFNILKEMYKPISNPMISVDEFCPICKESMSTSEAFSDVNDTDVIYIPYNHVFHVKCIKIVLDKCSTCPLCCSTIVINEEIHSKYILKNLINSRNNHLEEEYMLEKQHDAEELMKEKELIIGTRTTDGSDLLLQLYKNAIHKSKYSR